MEKKPCFPTVLVVNLFKTPEKKYVCYVCNITSIDYNLKYVDAGLARNENEVEEASKNIYIHLQDTLHPHNNAAIRLNFLLKSVTSHFVIAVTLCNY